MTAVTRQLGIAVLVASVAACGEDDPLDNDAQIAGWHNSSSALGVFDIGRQALAFADGEATFSDPACPATTNDNTTATLTGGCKDSQGWDWTGLATVVRGSNGDRTITLEDFGNDGLGGAIETTGTIAITRVASDHHTFVVDVTRTGGLDSTVEYSGSVLGTYDGPTTWNGAGTITRDGDFFVGGTVEAVTVDQVRDDDVCGGENLSGSTTITSDGHTVVVTYDGATACDGNHAARWSRDGKDMGLVNGIGCSTGGGASSGALLFVFGAIVLGRRRRR